MLFNPCIASITDALSILFTSPLVQWEWLGREGGSYPQKVFFLPLYYWGHSLQLMPVCEHLFGHK